MTTSAHNISSQDHSVTWCFSPSDFNGKEKDHESGFHYYGARYYWSELLTGWLSVDPMMDKYPSVSPYAYCAWNPVKMIDPNGMDTTFAGDKERELYLKYRKKVFESEEYRQVQNELIALEQSTEIFCIRMGDNISNPEGGGNFTYNVNTGQFDINIKKDEECDPIERLSHELKHADQYLNRKLTIRLTRSGKSEFRNYSIDDELEAYARQGLFGNTLSPEEIHKAYRKKGLSFYGKNDQYCPTKEDIWRNDGFKSKTGHPYILYHGWEEDL